ncbi:hypothetical protein [Acetobacter sp.]|jgi:hypothetical protein|uniref:hypothetical protein n=1 Tax=Acetobacter sp. TaxID=440 RepID=UPI00387EDB0C
MHDYDRRLDISQAIILIALGASLIRKTLIPELPLEPPFYVKRRMGLNPHDA